MVVRDLPVADHHVMREYSAHGLGEPAADRFVGYRERFPRTRSAGIELLERLVEEVQRRSRAVGLEVGPRPIAFQRVRPLRNLPLEGHGPRKNALGQVDLDARSRCLDVAVHVDQARKRRRPKPSDRAATRIECEMVLAVVPARGHDPAVLVRKVALLGRRLRVHVPGMPAIDRVTERILGDERLLAFPIVVVRVAEEDANPKVDLDEVVGDEFAVDDDARRHEHLATPVGHVLVGEVAVVGVLVRSPASEQDAAFAVMLVPG